MSPRGQVRNAADLNIDARKKGILMNTGIQSRTLAIVVHPASIKYLFVIALALPGSFLTLPVLGWWYNRRRKRQGSE